jgi:hypothetical protein
VEKNHNKEAMILLDTKKSELGKIDGESSSRF